MLLKARAFNEGARALALEAGLKADLSHRHPDERARQDAEDWMALMTPIIKAYCTDKGFENANEAMQCLGGHGYIKEWGLEQFVRDARITQIYEGANGIHTRGLATRGLRPGGGAEALEDLVAELADGVGGGFAVDGQALGKLLMGVGDEASIAFATL